MIKEIWDGGLGSLLQEKGLPIGELPERWNITHPEVIIEIHQAYIQAGATIINTNTFGANRLKFNNELKDIVIEACKLANKARKTMHENCQIALDLGPTGKLLKPFGDLSFDDAYQLYKEVIDYGKDYVDRILIETMTDTYEMKAAVLAAKENSDLPIYVSATFDETGKLLTGGTPEIVASILDALDVDGIGINCGLGPKMILPYIKRMKQITDKPLFVIPNAGLPKQKNGKAYYEMNAESFASEMESIYLEGIEILGGCCGTTPDHIKKMIEHLKLIQINSTKQTYTPCITSFSNCIKITGKPLLIGERINPTGKKKFKEALYNHDISYILQEGLKQEENGAHLLDVNVGLPDINEVELLKESIEQLQSITNLPLQIDTGNIEAMEKALRYYNGRPLLNSVNGKQEIMEKVFPLVKKYGAMVVALPIDENGIPENSEERIKIVDKIVQKASQYGIRKQDIIVDGLALTISSNQEMAKVTLETIQKARNKGFYTCLGVSNISFGLPQRAILNSHFLTLALSSGLTFAIINPNNEEIRQAYDSYLALLNYDKNFENYINHYADKKIESIKSTTQITLKEALEKGLKEEAIKCMKEEIQRKDGHLIVEESIVPALDKVGKDFETGKSFLPQLLMSAEAAKAAFEVLKTTMNQEINQSKGKILLATVQGDIHDIGKNIVKVMLENYGYQVLDCGKDVDPNIIVEKTLKEKIQLVGLSALMTTTAVNMEKTIKLLKKASPQTKIMVGGAVITQEYANKINADAYCKDAMESVKYANQVFKGE